MKKYSVTTPEDLRNLCIRKDWFTCGSNRQYDKLFYANEMGCPIEEIATIIWLCSDEDCRRTDILECLIEAFKEYRYMIAQCCPEVLFEKGVEAAFNYYFEQGAEL